MSRNEDAKDGDVDGRDDQGRSPFQLSNRLLCFGYNLERTEVSPGLVVFR